MDIRNDIDLKTWRGYEDALARYAKDPARYRLMLFLRWCLGYGLLCLFGCIMLLSILAVSGAGAVLCLIRNENAGFLVFLFAFVLFSGLYLLLFFRRIRIAGMPLDPEKFGRLYDEVNAICRDLKIAPIRLIHLDPSDRVSVVSPFRYFTNARIDRLVVGYPLICAMDARSFRVCLMRALMIKKAPSDSLLKWLGRAWMETTESLYAARTYRRNPSDYEKAEILRFYMLTAPLQREEARNRDAACREAFGARIFAAAVTQARFLAERCDPRLFPLRKLAEGPVQHPSAVIRDEVRKTLSEEETLRILGRMIRASEPVTETRPAFRERVGTEDPAALRPYLQGAPDAAEEYLFSCPEFEAEYDAWLEAQLVRAKTDEAVRRLREAEKLDESSSDPAAWAAALDAAARLGLADRERDLLEKAVKKFPDCLSFRGRRLVRRMEDAATAEEESEAAAELERLTEEDPMLVLEFHGDLYDFAVRRGDTKYAGRLFAARESAVKRIDRRKQGKKNSFLTSIVQIGSVILYLGSTSIFLLLIRRTGKYGPWSYFIIAAFAVVWLGWACVSDRKMRAGWKARKAAFASISPGDAGNFLLAERKSYPPFFSPRTGDSEDQTARDKDVAPHFSWKNALPGLLAALLMFAGGHLIVRTNRELDRLFEAGMTAYKAEDYATALNCFKHAAERGEAWAQLMLGTCYAEGKGVAQDYAEAVKWFRKAAEETKYRTGMSGAKRLLGDCYAEGKGVAQDLNEAVKWYRLAAQQDNRFAQRKLGDCYAGGRGVERDLNEAAKWYRLAAEQGDEEAQKALEELEKGK